MKPLLKHVEVAELRGVSAGCAKLKILPEVLGSEAVFPQARHNHLKPLRTLILSWMVHSKGSVLQPMKCFWADVPLTESRLGNVTFFCEFLSEGGVRAEKEKNPKRCLVTEIGNVLSEIC